MKASTQTKIVGDDSEAQVNAVLCSYPGLKKLQRPLATASPMDFIVVVNNQPFTVSVRTGYMCEKRQKVALRLTHGSKGKTTVIPSFDTADDIWALVFKGNVYMLHKSYPWLLPRWGRKTHCYFSQIELQLFLVHPGSERLNDLFARRFPIVQPTMFDVMQNDSIIAYLIASHCRLQVTSTGLTKDSLEILIVSNHTTAQTVGVRKIGRVDGTNIVNLVTYKGMTKTKISFDASCDIWAFVDKPRVFMLRKSNRMLVPFLGKLKQFRFKDGELDSHEVKIEDMSVLDELFA